MDSSDKKGIVVLKDAKKEFDELGIASWPTWGCSASKFPWSYSESETCFILEGEVTVTPDDKSLPAVSFEANDLVTFPAGMSCTWNVKKALNKHYKFG